MVAANMPTKTSTEKVGVPHCPRRECTNISLRNLGANDKWVIFTANAGGLQKCLYLQLVQIFLPNISNLSTLDHEHHTMIKYVYGCENTSLETYNQKGGNILQLQHTRIREIKPGCLVYHIKLRISSCWV